MRNLLNKFNVCRHHGTFTRKWKRETFNKYFWRYVTKVTWYPPPLKFFVTVCYNKWRILPHPFTVTYFLNEPYTSTILINNFNNEGSVDADVDVECSYITEDSYYIASNNCRPEKFFPNQITTCQLSDQSWQKRDWNHYFWYKYIVTEHRQLRNNWIVCIFEIEKIDFDTVEGI